MEIECKFGRIWKQNATQIIIFLPHLCGRKITKPGCEVWRKPTVRIHKRQWLVQTVFKSLLPRITLYMMLWTNAVWRLTKKLSQNIICLFFRNFSFSSIRSRWVLCIVVVFLVLFEKNAQRLQCEVFSHFPSISDKYLYRSRVHEFSVAWQSIFQSKLVKHFIKSTCIY